MEKNSQIKTRQMPFMKQIAKFSSRQYFPLYSISLNTYEPWPMIIIVGGWSYFWGVGSIVCDIHVVLSQCCLLIDSKGQGCIQYISKYIYLACEEAR